MKTRHILALVLAAAAALLGAACSSSNRMFGSAPIIVYGDGNVVEESRPISSISRIVHGGVGRLYIQRGAREELRVRAEENLLEYLMTEVQAGELVIWKDDATLRNTAPIEYHLTVVSLERVALTGAGGIQATNLDAGNLDLQLSGVGNVEIIDLNASRLSIDRSGVGETVLSGSVDEQVVSLRGWGNYEGLGLHSVVADVSVESGGSATVSVRDHLRATIRGSGNIYYSGDPTVESSIHGTGRVIALGK